MAHVDFTPLKAHIKTFMKVKPKTPRVIFVRKAESEGNLSGTIHGWMNFKLSDYG